MVETMFDLSWHLPNFQAAACLSVSLAAATGALVVPRSFRYRLFWQLAYSWGLASAFAPLLDYADGTVTLWSLAAMALGLIVVARGRPALRIRPPHASIAVNKE
jgi:hypothetical protein